MQEHYRCHLYPETDDQKKTQKGLENLHCDFFLPMTEFKGRALDMFDYDRSKYPQYVKIIQDMYQGFTTYVQ
jgi:hypothetical protein